MIRVFYGDDRVRIQTEVKKILGDNYEIFDGENLQAADIYNICRGNNLFTETRKILIKDLTPARGGSAAGKVVGGGEAVGSVEKFGTTDFYETLAEMADTKHEIIIWESTIPQKKSYKDFIKNKNVEERKFVLPEIDKWVVFRIYDMAYNNGEKAVAELNKIREDANNGKRTAVVDPYLTFGAFVSAAIKKYEKNQGAKEKRVLKELSKLDMQMKTTAYDPWGIISSFLLRLSSL